MGLLEVLFPQVRAEVLRLLFAKEGRELHLRELTRQSGLSLGTLQTEVEKLCAADLLLSRRDGNRRYFQANAAHPLFANLHQLVLKTAGLREVLAEALQEQADIELAFVFGSLAAGGGKADSDVDLMVIGDVGLRALAPRLRKAAEQLGREINPVTMTAADFVHGRVNNPFLSDVLAKEKLFIKGTADELARLA
ncbi:MAG: nucleotidyltransferase domain-containing protein [Verrucomicrobia bacterium]|nr:nucleotidyltransferase domain-containing protein [Verrucomicrobiota bacterium]